MRPGKRERQARKEQMARAAAVPDTAGHMRASLDAALKGNTIPCLKRPWDYLPKRVNGVARHSNVRVVG